MTLMIEELSVSWDDGIDIVWTRFKDLHPEINMKVQSVGIQIFDRVAFHQLEVKWHVPVNRTDL